MKFPTTQLSLKLRQCAILAVGMNAVLAFAQSSDNQEVLVQSGRLAQRQFDAPASVYAIDGQTIRNSGPQVNLSDVLNQAPGVVALNRNNYAQDVQISIRGFGARSAFGLRGFRLITDGIPATTPDGQGQASTVSLTSADRIEVLTGPLAQLYGNSAGGVIQVFTREAEPVPTLQSQIVTGSDGLSRTDWQFSQRSGNVSFVGDYSTFHIQGYRAHSEAKREQINTLMRIDVSPQTRIKLVANLFSMPYAKDPLGLTLAQVLANPKQAGNNAVVNDARKTVSQEQLGAVLEHQIDPQTRVQARVYGGARENLQYQASSATAGSWVGLDRNFHGLGLQVQGKNQRLANQSFDWVVGFDQDFSGEMRQGGPANAGAKVGSINRSELNESSNSDYFAQANWRLLPQLSITTGLRSSTIQLQSRDDYLADGANGSGKVTYKAVNPVLGATWHVNDALNLYLNSGRGFETPTLSESVYTKSGSAVIGLFNASLVPSRSQHLELGGKWTPSPQTRIDTALFRIQTDNEIVTSLSVGGRTAFTNAQQTLRQGLEISARHLWSPHWRTLVSATAINAQYGDNTPLAGKYLPGIPRQQLFSSIAWSEKGFQHANKTSLSGKEANLDWVARSRLWANDSNDASGTAIGYGMLNARVRQHFQWGQAQVVAFVGIDNLTDKRAVSSVIINQANKQFFEPALPRNGVIGVTAKLAL